MGLAGKVAGEVLGPRPGLAAVSFWGGRIEIILRILTLLVRIDISCTALYNDASLSNMLFSCSLGLSRH